MVRVYGDVTACFFELHSLLLGQEHLEGVDEDSTGFYDLDDVYLANEPLTCDLKVLIFATSSAASAGSHARWDEATQVVLRILKYTWLGKA